MNNKKPDISLPYETHDLLVSDRLEAAELALSYARGQQRQGLMSWRRPRIETIEGWVRRIFSEAAEEGDHAIRLLSGAEESYLWERATEAVLQSGSTEVPMPTAALADGLSRAARLASDWGIDLDALPPLSTEAQWLRRVAQEVEQQASSLGAIARHQCLEWLHAQPPKSNATGVSSGARPMCLLTGPLPRAVATLVERVQGATGPEATASHTATPSVVEATAATPTVVIAPDPEAEWRLAAEWAADRVRRQPESRLRVVIPGLKHQADAVQRVFEEVFAPRSRVTGSAPVAFQVMASEPLAHHPWVRQSLESLFVLFGSMVSAERLGRWWLAPFWGRTSLAVRAQIARSFRQRPLDRFTRMRWRTEVEAKLAMTQDAAAQECWSRLRGVDQRVREEPGVSGRATPGQWASLFSEALQLLLHGAEAASHGNHPGSADDFALQDAWRRLLEEFSGLGPVLGECTAEEAVARLQRIATRQLFDRPVRDVGVRVTGAMEPSYAGFDAIWVCGLRAEVWPSPTDINGYLPLSVLQSEGVTSASSERQLAEASRQLAAWQHSTSELVLSWAVAEDEALYLPSPLLKPWLPRLKPSPDEGKAWLTQVTTAPQSPLQRYWQHRPKLESYVSTSGLAWPAGQKVRGGVWALVDQANCPFSAYARRRLQTGDVEAPALGIDQRMRGQLLHEAFQALWHEVRDSQRLQSLDDVTLLGLIERALGKISFAALHEQIAPELSRGLQGRERERLRALMQAGLALDRQRPHAFRVSLSEEPVTFQIGPLTLDMRIDRVDELEDGRWLVIDYKSGRATSLKWSGEDFDAVQLWLYAFALEQRLSAALAGLAHFALRSEQVAYKGMVSEDSLLPGHKAVASLSALRGEAEQRIQQWAEDFSQGAASVAPRSKACQHCELPLLCRKAVLLAPMIDEEAP